MPNKLPDETQAAVEHLLRVAAREGVEIAGFAVSLNIPFTVMCFGTHAELAKDIKYYKLLCERVGDAVSDNKVVTLHVGKAN